MINWYTDIGELLEALGTSWFPITLQGALQRVFHYDYFFMVLCVKNGPLKIIRSDFQEQEINLALQYFESETYVVDPIYRLFCEGNLPEGVYKMADLAIKCKSLGEPKNYSQSFLIFDQIEEIGHRTKGWPKNLNEYCIIISINEQKLVAISLYNCGLRRNRIEEYHAIRVIFPALAALVRRHYNIKGLNIKTVTDSTEAIINQEQKQDQSLNSNVIQFFRSEHGTELTNREASVFAFFLDGITVPVIADELCISAHTVRTHRRNVYRKLGHGRLTELINQFHKYLGAQQNDKGK